MSYLPSRDVRVTVSAKNSTLRLLVCTGRHFIRSLRILNISMDVMFPLF